jgi:hypothetical protein
VKKLDVPQSGSQASTTASRGRFGQYNRTRAMPTQPRTAAQMAVRGYLTDASQAWRALTEAERAAWNAYAAVTGRADSLGQTIYLTGHQQFVGFWVLYSTIGYETPPAVPIDTPPAPPTADDLDIEFDDPNWLIQLNTVSAIPADTSLVVEASLPRSAGVSFEGDYRFIRAFTALAGGNAVFTTQYIARFGAPSVGQKIFVRARFVNFTSGPSAPLLLTGIAAVAPP